MMKNKITFLTLFCLYCCNLMAQEIPGKRDSINSILLKEKRVFQVVSRLDINRGQEKNMM